MGYKTETSLWAHTAMMKLPDSAIAELKHIYQTEFQKEKSDYEAISEARRLLLFFYELFKWEAEARSKEQLSGIESDLATTPACYYQLPNKKTRIEVGQLRLF